MDHLFVREKVDVWRIRVVLRVLGGGRGKLAALDLLDERNVLVRQQNLLLRHGVKDCAPIVGVLHLVQELVQLVLLLGLDNPLSVEVIANVLVIPVPLHGDFAHCVARVLVIRGVTAAAVHLHGPLLPVALPVRAALLCALDHLLAVRKQSLEILLLLVLLRGLAILTPCIRGGSLALLPLLLLLRRLLFARDGLVCLVLLLVLLLLLCCCCRSLLTCEHLSSRLGQGLCLLLFLLFQVL